MVPVSSYSLYGCNLRNVPIWSSNTKTRKTYGPAYSAVVPFIF
uniref:Uncharacterized protein n=1 Tax=Aegilops tauschii subsp. strangulata TaxID=200361 RepID=A0A453BD75_AEGTS